MLKYGLSHHFDSNIRSFARRNRQSKFSPLKPFIPLPKYFESEWSYAQYRIPVQSAHISLSSTTRSSADTEDMVEEERCTVGWIQAPSDDDPTQPSEQEYQLIALTYNGGWYRLGLPKFTDSKAKRSSGVFPSSASTATSPPKASYVSRAASISGSSVASGRGDKGKGKEKERDTPKETRNCTLHEFRRYGRWDGWG